ncbi:hypothetical protein [Pseudomonas sp. ACM7]|uniref:hypothetical protein n=1 Tax=Pseudomonas sp. ACM7 TaxID=2052956 RepID=UPI0013EA5B18|nr:hypothetical protein [Pseudomonas sp. ACM7]
MNTTKISRQKKARITAQCCSLKPLTEGFCFSVLRRSPRKTALSHFGVSAGFP